MILVDDDASDGTADVALNDLVTATGTPRKMYYGILAIGRDRHARRAAYTIRFLSRSDDANALSQYLAQHGDPAIGRAEMFEGVDSDRTLRDLGVEISWDALSLRIGSVGGLADEVDLFLAAAILAVTSLRVVHAVVEVAHADHQRSRVIDRHGPAGEPGACECFRPVARLPNRPGLGQIGQDDVVHPHPNKIADAPG